ncbi:MAG: RagB/SusD family nutrient uptake outer membrane protein, partial [Chitinophagaceae bacterium]|nr:RagB/SusD family nutrient uptake outer membrane protein [Chitinophagaceae bacterium]
GHRWFDLKRTGKINEVMEQVASVKSASWAPYKALLPIPYSEFEYNAALRGHQNEGYTEQP